MQDLIYRQTNSTALDVGVLGISLVIDGQIVDVREDPTEWPYQTVLDAIRDGWHIIQFPNQALLMDESRTYGLGCEFILEKTKT